MNGTELVGLIGVYVAISWWLDATTIPSSQLLKTQRNFSLVNVE